MSRLPGDPAVDVATGPSATDTEATYTVTDACTACGACLLTCPEHAFLVGVPLEVRPDRCTDCGECIEICPVDAIVRTPLLGDHSAGAEPLSVASRQRLHDRQGLPDRRGEA